MLKSTRSLRKAAGLAPGFSLLTPLHPVVGEHGALMAGTQRRHFLESQDRGLRPQEGRRWRRRAASAEGQGPGSTGPTPTRGVQLSQNRPRVGANDILLPNGPHLVLWGYPSY